MGVRVVQVSDLHTGTVEEPEVEDDLRRLVEEADPELVVASGDLTHRNRSEQHERAARLLRSLARPLLVIPGNHDIPMLPPWRFTSTFDAFLRIWGETEPVYRSDAIVACGLNSVRPWKQQGGALRSDQIERVARTFGEAPPHALRLVALHHHLLGAPWRTAKRTIATAPGLGQPRPKRRGEARGLHVFMAEERSLSVLTYAWAPGLGAGEGSWAQVADRRFPRGVQPLTFVG